MICRRRSGVGSVAASRSPLPLVMRDSIPRQPFLSRTLSPASPPRSSASPSPQKRSTVPRSPNTEKKHKRRRESGLLLPRTQKRMPEESESGHLSESQGRFRSSVGRGDAEVFGTAQLKGKGKTRAIEDVRMKDIAAQLATVNSMKANTKRDTVDMAPPHKESPSRGGLSPVGEEDGHDSELGISDNCDFCAYSINSNSDSRLLPLQNPCHIRTFTCTLLVRETRRCGRSRPSCSTKRQL